MGAVFLKLMAEGPAGVPGSLQHCLESQPLRSWKPWGWPLWLGTWGPPLHGKSGLGVAPPGGEGLGPILGGRKQRLVPKHRTPAFPLCAVGPDPAGPPGTSTASRQ